ncbi:MAG: hypothetical protein K6E29_07935 [Cyanobacteria bacterium RUI128]|nr:hypothetical protein [Cyanobacteria bacterium RUI128]
MAVGYAELAERVLPYTVGTGKPEYRTNPATGQKYTFAQLTQMVQDTSSAYNFSYDPSYLVTEKHAYDAMG